MVWKMAVLLQFGRKIYAEVPHRMAYPNCDYFSAPLCASVSFPVKCGQYHLNNLSEAA